MSYPRTIEQLQWEHDEIRNLVEHLCPTGSEFHDSPVNYIR